MGLKIEDDTRKWVEYDIDGTEFSNNILKLCQKYQSSLIRVSYISLYYLNVLFASSYLIKMTYQLIHNTKVVSYNENMRVVGLLIIYASYFWINGAYHLYIKFQIIKSYFGYV